MTANQSNFLKQDLLEKMAAVSDLLHVTSESSEGVNKDNNECPEMAGSNATKPEVNDPDAKQSINQYNYLLAPTLPSFTVPGLAPSTILLFPPKMTTIASSGEKTGNIRIPLPLQTDQNVSSQTLAIPSEAQTSKSLLSLSDNVLTPENEADKHLMDMDCFGPTFNEAQRPRWLSSLHSVIFIITCALAVFIVFRNVLTW